MTDSTESREQGAGDAARAELASIFEAEAEAALEARGPVPLRAHGGETRFFRVCDKNGKPTGKLASYAEVMQGAAKVAEIQLACIDGKRPEKVLCGVCRSEVTVPTNGGAIPRKCARCTGRVCSNCGKRRDSSPGRPIMCKECYLAAGKYSESSRKGLDALTPEQRSERARKANAARTPEQRSESRRKALAAMTPEQLSAIGRKRNARMTPEQRSAGMREFNAAKAEQP